MILAESGLRGSLAYIFHIVTSLAPLYFIFITQARAFYFARTIRHGGAKYFVSQRTVSTSHVPFHELFATYAPSHFYPAMDILAVLAVGQANTHQPRLFTLTWMIWLIAMCWLVVPFLYNVQATEPASLLEDLAAFSRWMRTADTGKSSPTESWEAWWRITNLTPTRAGWEAPALSSFLGLFYVYLGARLNATLGASWAVLAIAAVLLTSLIGPWLLVVSPGRPAARSRLQLHAALGALVATATAAALVVASFSVTAYDLVEAAAVVYFYITALTCALEVLLVESHRYVREPLRLLHRARDLMLAAALYVPLALLAVLWFPGELHKRLLFQNSFTRPTRGCAFFYLCCLLSVLAYVGIGLARS